MIYDQSHKIHITVDAGLIKMSFVERLKREKALYVAARVYSCGIEILGVINAQDW